MTPLAPTFAQIATSPHGGNEKRFPCTGPSPMAIVVVGAVGSARRSTDFNSDSTQLQH